MEKEKLKKERIYIRVTKDEKVKMKQKARNRKKAVSEVIRDMMKEASFLPNEVRDMQIAVAAEEICRYVETNYGTTDSKLRRRVKKLWELCQSN